MKKIYILLLSCLALMYFAQTPLDLKKLYQVNTFNGGTIFKTVFDDEAKNITVGYSNGPFTLGPEDFSTSNTNSLFIYKTNSQTGEKIWSKKISPDSHGSIIPYLLYSKNNYTYIGFHFTGLLTVKGITYDSNEKNWMVVKLDTNGNILWATATAQMVKRDYFDISVNNENIFALMNNNVFRIDDVTGELLSSFYHANLVLTTLKSRSDALFLGGKATTDLSIGTELLTKNAAVVIKTDLDYNVTSALQFYGSESSFNYIVDIEFLTDETLSFVGMNANKVKAYGENGLVATCDYNMSTELQSNLYMGRISTDFTDMKWFGGNAVSSSFPNQGVVQLFQLPNRKISLYYSPKNVSSVVNNYNFFNSNHVVPNNGSIMINYDENGYETFDHAVFIGNTSKGFDSKIINSSNYSGLVTENVVSVYEASNAYNYQVNYTHQAHSKKGNIILQAVETQPDGGFYSDAITQGTLLNFFGQNIATPSNQTYLRIISKVNADGTLKWKSGVEGIEVSGSNLYNPTRSSVFTRVGKSLSVSRCDTFNNCRQYKNDGYVVMPGTEGKVILTAFSENGEMEWMKTISALFSKYSVFQNKGDYFIAGTVNNSFAIDNANYDVTAWIDTVVIIKITAVGVVEFVKTFPFIDVYEHILISFDEDDNMYAFMEPIDWGSNPATQYQFGNVIIPGNPVNPDLLMVKFDKNGIALSGKNFTQNTVSAGAYLSDAKYNGYDFILYGGLYRSGSATYGLEGQAYQLPVGMQNTSAHNFIAKVSKSGDLIWETPIFSKAFGYGKIGLDMQSNIFIHGYWKEKLNIKDQEIGLSPIDLSLNVIKFTNQGNLEYSTEVGTTPFIRYGTSLAPQNLNVHAQSNGKIVISGNTAGTEILGSGIDHLNGESIYVAYLEEEVLKTAHANTQQVFIYPNPTTDFIFIKSKNKIHNTEIYDASGRKMIVKSISENQLDVRNLKKGVYYITITLDKSSTSSKFIKK